MKVRSDLPTGDEQMNNEALALLDNPDSADRPTDAIIILAQLDPTEVRDGAPRWSPDQQRLILAATEVFEGWAE